MTAKGKKRNGKSSPRGGAAAAKKRSIKSAQGRPLPEDGSALGAYPVGCAVRMDLFGEIAWYLIRFRIGGQGAPHVGRLSSPPDAIGWNEKMGPAVLAPVDVVVLSSRWPYRESAAHGEGGESGDDDPLALAPAAGSIMQSHLSGARGP